MSKFPRPPITQFRHIQLARFLLLDDLDAIDRFIFSDTGVLSHIRDMDLQELTRIVTNSTAFETAGCPGCNRPYYTARPSEEQDGYPRHLTSEEQHLITEELISLIPKNGDV